MADPVLRLQGITKTYGERVKTQALANVDLTLAKGEFAALIGPSGSGKSTLLNLIGLLDRPTAGTLWIDGVATEGLDDRALTKLRAQKLGFVFQFHHLLPAFSAIENVTMPIRGDTGTCLPEDLDHAESLLAAVGLKQLIHRVPGELSGGQQQRVAIARALIRQPPLCLADEPTGNLDTRSADEVFSLLYRFNRELGTAFLLVTHDPRIASRCDRIIELVDGRVERDASSQEPQLQC